MDDSKEKIITTPQQKKYYRIMDKLNSLRKIVNDENIPMWKRNQAAAKYLEIEKKYFPKVFADGKNGTYRKPKEETHE